MNKLILNFYFGRVALWKSYWLVGELLNALFLLMILNIEIRLFGNSNLNNFLPLINFNDFNFLSKILYVIWTVFISIGIWRSAENYKGNIIWIILTLIFLSYRVFTLRIIFF